MLEFSNEVFLCLRYVFNLANSEDADEICHFAVFRLGLHCLPKYPFIGYQRVRNRAL